MEIPEFNRHRMRTQIIKIIVHVYEAQKQLNLCDDHEKIIRNASLLPGIATLQLDFKSTICEGLDQLRSDLTTFITLAGATNDILEAGMDNPNNTSPPERGRFLALVDRTPLQRQLIREGHMPYSDIPKHYHQVPVNQNLSPHKPRKHNPDPPKKRIKRKPRNEMPM